jgi:hypothetical protein
MRNLLTLVGLIALIFNFSSCGDDDPSDVNYKIMEMKMVNLARQDTIIYNFSYTEGQLKQATISGMNINESYTASYDSNGKVTEAGNKRFEWDVDRLVKIIDDNGIWIDLSYDGNDPISGEIKQYDNSNQIVSIGALAITNSDGNLNRIEQFNISNQSLTRHTYSLFDNRTNMFRSIWWFHYVGETLSAFRSGILPDALFMNYNPGSYRYELPSQSFERTILYTYSYDGEGRVDLVEYTVGVDNYELIISY